MIAPNSENLDDFHEGNRQQIIENRLSKTSGYYNSTQDPNQFHQQTIDNALQQEEVDISDHGTDIIFGSYSIPNTISQSSMLVNSNQDQRL